MATILNSVVPGMLERGSVNMSMLQDRKMQEMGINRANVGKYRALAAEAAQKGDTEAKAEYDRIAEMYIAGAGMRSVYDPYHKGYVYRATNFLENEPPGNLMELYRARDVVKDGTTQQNNPFGIAAKIKTIMDRVGIGRYDVPSPYRFPKPYDY